MTNDDNLTLRDKFAIEVLQALIGRIPIDRSSTDDIVSYADEYASDAYKIADAMRRARLIAFK